MNVEEVEHMKAKIITASGAAIFVERTSDVPDAEWHKALATIHLADEVTKAARRVVKHWSSRRLAEAVQRLDVALAEVRHWARSFAR